MDRRILWLAPLLALALSLPALTVGLHSDDLAHGLAVRGQSPFPAQNSSIWRLFTFTDGNPDNTRQAVSRGALPWWTDPHLRMSFCRPLTALTHWLDFRLLGDRPVLMHLQNSLWFAAMAAAAALAYRRLIGAGAAGVLAAILFAVDDAHAGAVGWVSGRNGLIASTLALLALVAHDVWRRGKWRAGAVLAPLLLALGLLAGEAAVPIGGYLIAYALFLDRGGWYGRALSLSVYVPVIIGWRILYAWGGYGAFGSGTYVDPLSEPVRFLQSIGVRGPVQLLAVWALPFSDVYEKLSAAAAWAVWAAAATFSAALVLLLARAARRDAAVRFWALGMLLAVVPNCATIPADRILILVGFGAHALIARFLADTAARWRKTTIAGSRPHLAGAAAALLAALHLAAAPVLLPVRAAAERHGTSMAARLAALLPADAGLGERHLVVVQAGGAWWGPLFYISRAYYGLPVPERITLLASGSRPLQLTRVNGRTVRVRPEGGFLPPPRTPPGGKAQANALMHLAYRLAQADRAFRAEPRSIPLGYRVELPGVRIEVTAQTEDGRPAEALFEFEVPLEDERMLWFRQRGDGFVAFAPPAPGESVVVSPLE